METGAGELAMRRATPADIGTVGRVRLRAWRTAYKGIIPDGWLDKMDEEVFINRARDSILGGERDVWLAELCGQAVGFFAVQQARAMPAGTGEIGAIYLLLEHRGRGFGGRMMEKAEALLLESGNSGAVIWVLEKNTAACGFYESCGYAPDGARMQTELGKKLWLVRYRKPFPGPDVR